MVLSTRSLTARRRIGMIALGGLLMLGLPATAQKAAKGNGHGDGQKAAVDSNGKLRDLTPEESKQLSDSMDKMLDTNVESLKAAPTKSGSMAIDLGDGFQSAALAKVGADGKVVTKCVSSAAEGKQFFGVNHGAKKKAINKSSAKSATQTSTNELETR